MTDAVPTGVGDEPADRVAAAVEAVAGVAALHPGRFGEIGSYLPGRRVAGVRIGDDRVEVHVAVFDDAPLHATATAVRAAVGAVTAAAVVDVTVEDLVGRGERDEPRG